MQDLSLHILDVAENGIQAGATLIEIDISEDTDSDLLQITIKDNGKGFPEGKIDRFGNGLSNMRNRMKSINGNLTIENQNGTKITLSLKV